jgi:hypothetical protein
MYSKLVAIIVARGFTPRPTDFVLRDDGRGPYIAGWDTRVGAQPTADEIDAVPDATADAVVKDQRSLRLAEEAAARAVARAAWEELGKMTPRAGQTPRTWDEFRARVKELIAERLT